MTTRSSRSSLVGPPTTVAEDDDNGSSQTGSLPYHGDENHRPNWNTERGGVNHRYRYANDAIIEDLDCFALSPPIERVIKDFNEELDSITKVFESFSQRNNQSNRNHHHLLDSASSVSMTTTPAHHHNHHNLSYPSTAKRGTSSPLREKDPPPSEKGVSPLRNFTPSTPARRSGSASYTPSEPPPAPVETPGFGFPTPNRNRNRNRTRTRETTAPRMEEASTSSYAAPPASPPPPPPSRRHSRDPLSSGRSRREEEDASVARRENERKNNENEVSINNKNDGSNSNNNKENDENAKYDSNRMIQELEKKVREQEMRILDLEIENEVLRKKLQLVRPPPPVERVHHSASLSEHLRHVEEEAEEPPPTNEFVDNNDEVSEPRAVPPPTPNHHRYQDNDQHRRHGSASAEMAEPEGSSRRGEPVTEEDGAISSSVRDEPEGRHQPAPPAASIGITHSPYRTQSSLLSTPSRRHPPQQRRQQQQQQLQPSPSIGPDRPPRHIQTLSRAIEETAGGDFHIFTPGTRFVAELATLMKLEPTHYVPLSVIMDKHWNTLKHHFQSDNNNNIILDNS